jgi:hypothetical protein
MSVAGETERAGCGRHAMGRYWPKSAEVTRAEHVRSAQVIQTSTCSAMARASSIFDAEIPDCAFDLGVAQEDLHRS